MHSPDPASVADPGAAGDDATTRRTGVEVVGVRDAVGPREAVAAQHAEAAGGAGQAELAAGRGYDLETEEHVDTANAGEVLDKGSQDVRAQALSGAA